MAAKTMTEPFHYCWSAVLDECDKSGGVFFTKNDCFIEDTRDADFEKIENRLSYMYKFGHINVILVEKCALTFFDQYFQGDRNYFSGNLKICSLSNGPGIDIAGFLRALYKSNKLKCCPLLQAINLHDSWKAVFHNLACSAYHEYNSNFNETRTVIPSENIQFIQCDIFSNLSSEVQNVISSCDILLMVKVLISTKAAPNVLTETMQKIFSLLQPGSLVLFFGNKNNIKEIITKDYVKEYVNCLFGPIKLDLQQLSVDENVFKISNFKTDLIGRVHFIVLQRNVVAKETVVHSSQNVTKSKEKRTRQKETETTILAPNSNEISESIIMFNDSEDENDADSESCHTCSSKQPDTISIQSRHLSHENKFQSMASQNLHNVNCAHDVKQSLSLSVENTSLSENTLPLEQNTEPVARKDAITKENLTGGLPLKKLPVFHKSLSHERIAENSVNSDRKRSSQLGDLGKVLSPDGALSVIMDMTSKKNAERTETVIAKQMLPSVSLHHVDLFQTEITACKETEMLDASCDRNKSADISRQKACPPQINCNSYSGAEKDVKTSNAAKQSQLASQRQFQPESKSTFCEQFGGAGNSNDLHSTLQHIETLVTLLEKVVARISTDEQFFQNSEEPMEDCCFRYVPSTLKNSHCCMPYDNFSDQSCCRKICHCMRARSNISVARSNYSCYTEHINDAHRCHNEITPKPYFAIPLENKNLLQILRLITEDS